MVSNFVAMIHSFVFTMSIFKPGMLPNKPVELFERILYMFLANCWVMVEAPRAS